MTELTERGDQGRASMTQVTADAREFYIKDLRESADMMRRCRAASFEASSLDRIADILEQDARHREQAVQEAVAPLNARIAELEAKLIAAETDILWNAYQSGHEKDGRWTHMFMSEGEWLVQRIGLDPKLPDYDAEQIKAAIPIAARAALQEIDNAHVG